MIDAHEWSKWGAAGRGSEGVGREAELALAPEVRHRKRPQECADHLIHRDTPSDLVPDLPRGACEEVTHYVSKKRPRPSSVKLIYKPPPC